MHASSHGGGVLCSASPQQVKGGTGLVGIVERDAISPGRAPGTSQSTQRTDLLNTLAEKTLPPKTHTPVDWRLRTTGRGGEGRGERIGWYHSWNHQNVNSSKNSLSLLLVLIFVVSLSLCFSYNITVSAAPGLSLK